MWNRQKVTCLILLLIDATYFKHKFFDHWYKKTKFSNVLIKITTDWLNESLKYFLSYIGPLKTEDSENLSNSFPFSAIPLLIFHHPEFQMVVNGLVDLINSKYEQLQSLMDTNRHEVCSRTFVTVHRKKGWLCSRLNWFICSSTNYLNESKDYESLI